MIDVKHFYNMVEVFGTKLIDVKYGRMLTSLERGKQGNQDCSGGVTVPAPSTQATGIVLL